MKNVIFIFCFLKFLIANQETCDMEANEKIQVKNFKNFLNSKIYENTVLIAEFATFHLECLPGFTKYFIDLGYKVDILLNKRRSESMEKFRPLKDVKIFEFKRKELKKKIKKFKNKIKYYKFLLLETIQHNLIRFYKKIGIYNNPNSLFVIHHIDELYSLGLNKTISKNYVFGLADYGTIPYVNPNYFGNFKLSHEKNKNSFFITATRNRYFNYIIEGVSYLKNKSIDFEINVVGNGGFNKFKVPIELRNYFHFYGQIRYQKMYNIVKNTDFIIINLYPNRTQDKLFKTFRATGNTQLAYGFYKPVIIEESFAKVYKFSNETAIIFKENDIPSAMLKAATMSKEEYQDMSIKVKNLQENIYNLSLNNLKKVLKNL